MVRPLGDFSTDARQLGGLTLLAAGLGVLAALLAVVLLDAIALITNLAYHARLSFAPAVPSLDRWGPWSVLVPVAGALVVGVIARFGSEKIRGHGIPEALQSILERESIIPARLLLFKPLASAITIGTGGPFGAEGPIIMSGGALGSLAAQFLLLTPVERRVLLVAGAAAGMSATFGSPVAAVFLAVELLLFEWRPRSLVPVAVASIVAYALRARLLGTAPVFAVAHAHAFEVTLLPWALALGVLVGGVSGVLTVLVYAVEDLYGTLRLHWMWWPALGAIIVGAGGMIAPQALGVGYPTISALVNGQLALSAVVAIVVVKAIIWIVSLSSGTSGGVLAPLLLLGAGTGALASVVLPLHDPALWAAIAMAAMLGGTMRAPFTATIFALETTHEWSILVGVFAAAVAATATTVVFVRRSILTEKLARRGTHVAREYAVHPLERTAVAQIMVPRAKVETVRGTLAAALFRARLGDADARHSHATYPVVDAAGALEGVVRRGRVLAADATSAVTVSALVEPAVVVRHDQRVREAVELMARTEHRGLVVVDEHGGWVGFLDQGDVLDAWRTTLGEEERRRRHRRLPAFLRRTAVSAGERSA